MTMFNVPRYDAPELVIDGNDVQQFHEVWWDVSLFANLLCYLLTKYLETHWKSHIISTCTKLARVFFLLCRLKPFHTKEHLTDVYNTFFPSNITWSHLWPFTWLQPEKSSTDH